MIIDQHLHEKSGLKISIGRERMKHGEESHQTRNIGV